MSRHRREIRCEMVHHAVYTPKKSSSQRVVFDCDVVFHSRSLNAYLILGPDILKSLICDLCQFREQPIALMGDIEKMLYCFKLKKEHRDYLRLLWWKDSDMTLSTIDCRMTVNIFRVVISPERANFALGRLANDNITFLFVKPSNLFRSSSMLNFTVYIQYQKQ